MRVMNDRIKYNARFDVVSLFNSIELKDIESALVSRVNELIANTTLQIKSLDELAFIRNFHKTCTNSSVRHIEIPLSVRKAIRLHNKIQNMWSDISDDDYEFYWTGDIRKNEYSKNRCGFRWVRCNALTDAAPPHIDGTVGGHMWNEYPKMLSLWVPINEEALLSSLPILESCKDGNLQLEESSFNKSISRELVLKGPLRWVKPCLQKGDVVVFDGTTIHKGAVNTANNDRVSIEIRLYESGWVESAYESLRGQD